MRPTLGPGRARRSSMHVYRCTCGACSYASTAPSWARRRRGRRKLEEATYLTYLISRAVEKPPVEQIKPYFKPPCQDTKKYGTYRRVTNEQQLTAQLPMVPSTTVNSRNARTCPPSPLHPPSKLLASPLFPCRHWEREFSLTNRMRGGIAGFWAGQALADG
ncbi:hypothetical protein FHL15_003802 [Xylaria flabelliformis]|uniref:Uncharacterized protein n=1 Tax=Xylaria flabelliformis TaxID=2512241 RepID=A0A553I5J0_9PEZI|nr:hypothetical protein FHL15_003802 [Xylaria flabelliformis]